VSPIASFPQASPPTPCAHLYPPPYAPHALPILFVSILPPAQYWARSTDHSGPDAHVTEFILSDDCSTCLGYHYHPSSGAQITASGNRCTVLLSAANVEELELI
jgi:hypothetical protein